MKFKVQIRDKKKQKPTIHGIVQAPNIERSVEKLDLPATHEIVLLKAVEQTQACQFDKRFMQFLLADEPAPVKPTPIITPAARSQEPDLLGQRNALWDALSDLLEEGNINLDSKEYKAALTAIESCQRGSFTCQHCGRKYEESPYKCTSDDCPGNQKPAVIITVEGGIVQSVHSDADLRVVVNDIDNGCVDEDDRQRFVPHDVQPMSALDADVLAKIKEVQS